MKRFMNNSRDTTVRDDSGVYFFAIILICLWHERHEHLQTGGQLSIRVGCERPIVQSRPQYSNALLCAQFNGLVR